MANVNAPFGFKPIRYVSGSPYNGACNEYFATGASGAIYIGDLVVAAGSANSTAVQGRAAGTLPTVGPALDGAGDPYIGVCVGVVPVTGDSLVYRADSTDRIILVADDPNLVYIAQCNAGGTAFAVGDTGALVNMGTGTPSTVTGRSGMVLDTGTAPASTVTYQFRLNRLHSDINNEVGAYAVWEVFPNNHILGNVTDAGRVTPV